MIVFRVLTVERQRAGLEGLPPFYPFSSRRTSRLQLVTRSIIESGLMYTTMSVIVFITFLLKSNAIYITSAAVSDSVLFAVYFAKYFTDIHVHSISRSLELRSTSFWFVSLDAGRKLLLESMGILFLGRASPVRSHPPEEWISQRIRAVGQLTWIPLKSCGSEISKKTHKGCKIHIINTHSLP